MTFRRIFCFVFIVFFATLPLWSDVFHTRLFTRILIFALLALSLDLVVGYGGMVSFGHAAFFGTGAYMTGLMSLHGITDALVVWPAAAGAAMLIALPIGALSLRTRGAYFIMITLAFAQMIYYFASGLETFGGSDGMRLLARNTLAGKEFLRHHEFFYYVAAGFLAGAFLLCRRLTGSRFGLILGGIRQNEKRMQSLGYATFPYKLTCFVISAALAGLSGALMANETLYISPSLLHWTQSGHALVMVILGGMGTLAGPVLGAIVLLLMEEILSAFTQHWMIVLGPLLILVVLYARGGLYGLWPQKKVSHVTPP